MTFSFLAFPNSSYRSLQARVCWQRAVATDAGAQPGYLQCRPSGVCQLVWNMGGSIIIINYHDLTFFITAIAFFQFLPAIFRLVNYYYCSASRNQTWITWVPIIYFYGGCTGKIIRKWMIFLKATFQLAFFDWDNMFKTNNMTFGCVWTWSLPNHGYLICWENDDWTQTNRFRGMLGPLIPESPVRGVRVWCSRVCLAAWSFLYIWIFGIIWVCPIAEYIPNPMCLPSCLYHHAPYLMDTTVTKLHRGATILGDSLRLSLHTGSLI